MNATNLPRLLAAAVMIGGLSGCATMTVSPAETEAADSGYFLSLKQKGQLIGQGKIQDAQGIWYDIWIVPGYLPPAQKAKHYLGETGSDFAEYIHRDKYRDIAESSGEALEWAYKDCLTDFTIKGIPRAWGRYWSTANRRTSQKVFGWWLAYPWALLESTVDTAVRFPFGLAGTAMGTAWGVAVVPGYYAVNSAVAGTWHFAVDTVLMPSVGITWNTVVAPPMALIGQKPAPSRADGFWVRNITAADDYAALVEDTPNTPEDVEALVVWGQLLFNTYRPFEEKRRILREQTRAEHDEIDRKARLVEAEIAREEQEAVNGMEVDATKQATIAYLQGHGIDSRRMWQMNDDIRGQLRKWEKLSQEEIDQTMSLLFRYPPLTVTNLPEFRAKTTPLDRSIEIIHDLE